MSKEPQKLTRRARLAGGSVLEFPADTPDQVMHSEVRRHMGLPPPEPKVDPGVQQAQLLGDVIGAAHTMAQQMAAVADQMARAIHAIGASHDGFANAAGRGAESGERHAGALVAAQQSVSDAVSRMMSAGERQQALMREIISAQVEVAKAMTSFGKQVEGVSRHLTASTTALKQVGDAIDRLVEAQRAPRDLVLDDDGNPTGVRVV